LFTTESGKVISTSLFGRQVSQTQHYKHELEKSNDRYRSLFEDSIDSIFLTDTNGTLVDANPAFFNSFGYSREELIGNSILCTYVEPEDRVSYIKTITTRGSVKDYPLNLKKKDGTILDCLITAVLRKDKNEKILGYRGIIRDNTEKNLFQKQMLHAQKMESIGVLAGGIAHDVSNILQVIMGYSEILITTDDLNPKQFEHAKKVNDAALQGRKIIQQFLTFSRKNNIELTEIDLNDHMTELNSLLVRLITPLIKCNLDLSKDIHKICVDLTQFNQVMMNLVVNAKESLDDKGTITIKTYNHDIETNGVPKILNLTGPYVVVEVSDTGCGIPEDIRNKIFDPFFTTKEMGDKKGTGLGLSVISNIMKLHKGFIDCTSKVGEGTTFRLFFPAVISNGETV
jgi:PAS domain S-box-containing protein